MRGGGNAGRVCTVVEQRRRERMERAGGREGGGGEKELHLLDAPAPGSMPTSAIAGREGRCRMHTESLGGRGKEVEVRVQIRIMREGRGGGWESAAEGVEAVTIEEFQTDQRHNAGAVNHQAPPTARLGVN
ncbi:hypothetical protein CgunFtcFv8_016917 [Champsocephalus gunnari]|uniref:Uncharacterized protein n=1 Tax=Champsocephalus gunnari TaxID=52237 RepID=A0AAN8HAL8_CHAGU|nr:hypothetical protein CgunFtcFv8_016917 [Champsocephalus gunnari]